VLQIPFSRRHAWTKVGAFAIEFAPRLLAAALVLAIGWFVTGWAMRILRKALVRLELELPVQQLLERVLRALMLGLVLIIALQNLGVELLLLIAGLRIAGAGVAFAMQGVLSNVAAGLTIIFTKPFRVGEYISIAGEILHNYGAIRQLALAVRVGYEADLDAATRVAHEVLNNNPRVLREPAAVVLVAALADPSSRCRSRR
jgi:small conductance mechanosensitive channel